MLSSFITHFSKLFGVMGKPRSAVPRKIFRSDLILVCLAGAVLVVAYFTVTRSILALEFSQALFERIP
jgi:hypothetical protein